MALIKCSECGKEFSDKAELCPNCGCPTEEIIKELKEKSKDNCEVKDSDDVVKKDTESISNDIANDITSSNIIEEKKIKKERKTKSKSTSKNTQKKQNEVLFPELEKMLDSLHQILNGSKKRKTKSKSKDNDKLIKKVAIIFLSLPLLVMCFFSCAISESEKFDWDELVLGNLLPEPCSKKGDIIDNSISELLVEVDDISTKEYYAYVTKCEEKNFIVDTEKKEFNYSAYNNEGYLLKLDYSEYMDILTIELKEPMKLDTIDWNFKELGSHIPKLDSKKGKVLEDGKDCFSLYVGDIKFVDFENYVKTCSEKGFNIGSESTKKTYKAKNSEGYYLEVEYIGNNVIKIKMNSPVYNVKIKVIFIGNSLFNTYDVDATVDEYKSVGLLEHGKNKTLDVELTKGKHTLCLKSEPYDNDAKGTKEFEVTGNMEISFKISCKTDEIVIENVTDQKDPSDNKDENNSIDNNSTVDNNTTTVIGKNEVSMPQSYNSYTGNGYQDVKKDLQNLGFENIEINKVYDVGTGWFSSLSLDKVKTISIAGNNDFNKGDIFNKKDKVIITYGRYKIEDPSIKYTKYTVDTMIKDLDKNAARAKDKYEDKYVEIKGRVGIIDGSAEDFDLDTINTEWELRSVTCNAKIDDHENKIKKFSKGDIVTVRGKITLVSEFGFVMDIYSFK